MDYFCQQCSAKPGWAWDETKAFQHSCQRCFRNLPCNDYSWKKPQVHQSPAPRPKDLVPTQLNAQSQVDLPKAKGTPAQPPVPVYPVAPPPGASEAGSSHPVPPGLQKEDHRNEADKALDALQPNRPGVKLETKRK